MQKKTERIGAKATRLLALIMMLKNRAYTIDELTSHFGTTKRTIYRDLEDLREDLKCPLLPSDGLYQIDKNFYMPALALTEPELLALFLACRTLEKRGALSDEARSAFEKLRLSATVPKKNLTQLEDVIELAPARGTYPPELIKEAIKAYNESKVLEISYLSRERQEPVSRKVEPWGFFFWQEMFYLVGFDHLSMGQRTFRLDRMRELTITTDSYQKPADFNPSSAMFHRFDVGEGPPVSVRLKVDQDLARHLAEMPAHPTQTIKGLEVEFQVKAPLRMTRWLLGLGQLEVLEPIELRQDVARQASEIARKHA